MTANHRPEWPRIPAPQQRINEAEAYREEMIEAATRAASVLRRALIIGAVLLAAPAPC